MVMAPTRIKYSQRGCLNSQAPMSLASLKSVTVSDAVSWDQRLRLQRHCEDIPYYVSLSVGTRMNC